ncbi:class II aldolase/adducin family protein [Microbacterium koreense]|uniref:Class II aldolase/adducin family protein n=1 Tax=Microbacterium koreense TaxID=323761 RepID=A0ABW2ZNL8_9MICO
MPNSAPRPTAHHDAVRQLIRAGGEIVDSGLALASAGNLSVRLDDDRFVVSASGTWLNRFDEDSFTVMTLAGDVVGGAPRPSSEWKLHQRAYLARPDVGSVVHVHPAHAILLDAMRVPVRLITLDHAFYVASVGRTPYYPNGSDELADTAAEQLRTHNCLIMGNHGSTTVGDDLDMALRRALNLENAAEMTYRALVAGRDDLDFPWESEPHLHHA